MREGSKVSVCDLFVGVVQTGGLRSEDGRSS